MPISIKNPKEMSKKCLPNSNLKFMNNIWDKQAIVIEFKRAKALRKVGKGILNKKCEDIQIPLNQRKPTRVGTADIGPKIRSILMLVMLTPFSNNIFLTTSISNRRVALFTRASLSQLFMSVLEPTSVIFDLSDMHRGHMHLPRNLMHKMSILKGT